MKWRSKPSTGLHTTGTLPDDKKIDITARGASLDQVLAQAFTELPLNYTC